MLTFQKYDFWDGYEAGYLEDSSRNRDDECKTQINEMWSSSDELKGNVMEIERIIVKMCEVLGIGQGDVLAIATVFVSSYAWTIGGWLKDAKGHQRRKPIAKTLTLLARFCVPLAVVFLICWLVFMFADPGKIVNDSVVAGSLQMGALFAAAAAIMWGVQLSMGDEDDVVLISSYSRKELESLRCDMVRNIEYGGATTEEAETIARAVIVEAVASEFLESNKKRHQWSKENSEFLQYQ